MNELSVEDYRAMKVDERRAYLQVHVLDNNRTDVSGQFFLEALRTEADATAQWFLIKGVGILRLAAGIPEILRVCRLPEVEMRHTSLHSMCAWSLGRMGASVYEATEALLTDPQSETRRCAADALGEIGDKRAVAALCGALERDEHRVKLWAGLSLAKMGNDALPCLERLMKESDASVRQIAADAVGKIERKEFVSTT